MLPDALDKLLGTSFAIIAAIIGLYVVVRFINRKSQPFILEITNHIVLFVYLLWFGAYALATNVELDAMRRVFDATIFPGLSVSYALLALAFSVSFSLLIITHRNLYLSFPVVMALGFSDMYGNLEIITGMQFIIQSHGTSGTEITTPEGVWISYYLANPQLIRISAYMFVCYIGFCLFLLSRYNVVVTKGEPDENNGVKNFSSNMAEFSSNHRISLEVAGKLIFILALIVNELTMWSWRYDREQMFAESGYRKCSGYISWSPSEFYRFNSDRDLGSLQKIDCKSNITVR